jgi:hypothetical protein
MKPRTVCSRAVGNGIVSWAWTGAPSGLYLRTSHADARRLGNGPSSFQGDCKHARCSTTPVHCSSTHIWLHGANCSAQHRREHVRLWEGGVTGSLPHLPLRFSQPSPADSQATQGSERRVPLLPCKSWTAAVGSGLRLSQASVNGVVSNLAASRLVSCNAPALAASPSCTPSPFL